MPVVGELFGFPFGSPESLDGIAEAQCPYMQARCDGGGNRDMANVALANDSGLRSRFSSNVIRSGSVSCAICSVGMSGSLKIICPRRLLNFGLNGFSAQHLELVKLLCHTAASVREHELIIGVKSV